MNMIKIPCQGCGKSFEPTPDSYIEEGYTPVLMRVSDEEADAIRSSGEACVLCLDQLAVMTESELEEIGLDIEARNALLQAQPGEHVTTGAIALCPRCMEEWDV